jgi:site-specific DNA-methyltransferase (adenine-specific)
MELKYANIKLESDYNLLLKSGMFWVAYPELTGDWSKDSEVINPKQLTESRSTINLHLGDCLEAMREMPNNAFELAIVDVPYGINEGSEKIKSRHHSQKKYKVSDWDKSAPEKEYFTELMRVSKHQIVWGANHFISSIPFDSSCWIVWDKDTGECDFADAELAWTSFKTAVRMFKFTWNGFRQGYVHAEKENRIHPTQKPVKLYEWLLTNYAKEGDKILDTHFGSGSHGIACGNLGFSIDAWELDPDYFHAAHKRIESHFSQLNAFQTKPIINTFI